MAASSPTSASRPRARKKLYGSETPRVWTQPLRELTSTTSAGFACIEFATDVLHFELLPWQRWLLIHALELRPDGRLRFRNVVVLVSRQNGKSTLSQVLSLWWLFVLGVRLVLGTAQDLDVAEEIWQGAVDLVHEQDEDEHYIRPEMVEMVGHISQRNGSKALKLKTGERYKIKAANRRAGRSMSGDRIILDELREHQNWEAWAALTKTTMARPKAQVWCFSNAGDSTSVVLRHLRKIGHQPLGDPDGLSANEDVDLTAPPPLEDLDVDQDDELEDDDLDDVDETDLVDFKPGDDLGLFEWSAPPGCSVWDRAGWAQANPSLGYTVEAQTIASAAATDPEWVFRTEVLCQWPEGVLVGPFPAGTWDDCQVKLAPGAKRLPASEQIIPGSRIYAALEVSKERKTACVTVAGRRPDGLAQVEVRAVEPGTDWVLGWFGDPKRAVRKTYPIVIRTGSPAWTLAPDLIKAGYRVVEWKGTAVADGCGLLFDAVKDRKLRHTGGSILNVPAGTASTRILERGAWVWDSKRSPHDIAALWGATGALWALNRPGGDPPPPPPPPAVVESAPGLSFGGSVAARAGF